MLNRYKIQVVNHCLNETVDITGEFAPDEWQRLTAFHIYAHELNRSHIIQRGMPLTYQIHWREGESLQYTCVLPPDDDIAALLHRMRPFVLQEEDASFYRVSNLLSHRWDNPVLRGLIQQYRDLFSGKTFQSQIQIRANGVLLNAENTLTKWLNAFEYHRDAEKRKELEALHELMPLKSSKVLFINMVLDKAQAVLRLHKMIRGIIAGKRLQITLSPREFPSDIPDN